MLYDNSKTLNLSFQIASLLLSSISILENSKTSSIKASING